MNLPKLFNPKSVGVVGASRDEKKIGGIVVRNIRESGFSGVVYPVNPKAEEIQGLKCYPSFESLPETPDLAVIAVPSELVMEVMKGVVGKGTRQVVVFSAGYGETGEEGKKREAELVEFCRQNKVALLGPNCLGFVSNLVPINVTFGQVVKTAGNLRFMSQSGAIASSIFDWFEANGLGFSEFVTLGNKAVVGENEVLEYWLSKEAENKEQSGGKSREEEIRARFGEGLSDVWPVGMYLESVVEGRRFLELVSKVSRQDPVFVLKPGKSKAAVTAMQSHTGAIAGEDAVMEAALAQAGAIRCEGIEDMFDLVRAFAWEKAPDGPEVAVVSNAGGPAVISADVIEEVGLRLATIDDETHSRLVERLPRAASIVNPVDVLGDALAQRYGEAMEILLAEEEVKALVVILTPQVMTQIEETARLVGELAAKYGKPVLCSFMGGSHIRAGEEVLNRYRIPSFRYPERAIRALGAMWKWRKWQMSWEDRVRSREQVELDKDKVRAELDRARVRKERALGGVETLAVLEAARIRVPEMVVVEKREAAFELAERVGWPVVVKLSGPELLHKTEVGGVKVGIMSGEQLEWALEMMEKKREQMRAAGRGEVKILVQKQIEGGVEVICGVKRDVNFGPVMMFGAGGTLAELVEDRNLHLLPIDRVEALGLVERSRVGKLLGGFRGGEPADVDGLVELMMALAQLAEEFEEIGEVEINPVIVRKDGVWAVDGKLVILGENE